MRISHMMPNNYPVFLDWLTDLAACLPNAPALDRAAPLYFAHLQHFDLSIVREALQTALQTCDFFPSLKALLELARDIRRARFEAERQRQTKHKLLAYQTDAEASGLAPAEIQARIAELLAVVGDSMRMDYDGPPEPLGPPRPLHEAYRTPTVDDAARKRLLRDQMARVLCMEEEERQREWDMGSGRGFYPTPDSPLSTAAVEG
jgi:hypothetical protein